MKSIGAYFVANLDDAAERSFLTRADGWKLSYADAATRVVAGCRVLADAGLGPGDRVFSYVDEAAPLALFQLSCMLSRVLPVPISPAFSPAYLRKTAELVGARHVFTTPERAGKVEAEGFAVQIFTDGSNPYGDRTDTASLRDWHRSRSVLQGLAADIGVEEPCIILPTSGSTGQPKMVLRNHLGFARYAHYVGEQIRSPEPPRFLAAAALTHAFGLHMFTTCTALRGTLCIPTQIDTGAQLSEIWTLAPTVVPTTPRILRSLHSQCLREWAAAGNANDRPMFPPSTSFVFTAGGKSDPELLRLLASQGITPIDFYGSCEGSVVAVTPRGQWRPGVVGNVVDDCSVKLAEDGELLVRSPGLMIEYYGQPELTAEAMTEDGYFRTGDLGDPAPDGSLRIIGRKRDIFSGCFPNVYPERIEDMIEAIPGVRQAFLIGDYRPHLVAFVVLDETPTSDQPDGYLPPRQHAPRYRELGAALSHLNQRLEPGERIIAFALFGTCFPNEVYALVGPGKVRRVRAAFEALFRERIAQLYADDARQGEPHIVAPAHREVQPRATGASDGRTNRRLEE
jgi:long-subunit acyl-CoA synthetase (AMP-forming)